MCIPPSPNLRDGGDYGTIKDIQKKPLPDGAALETSPKTPSQCINPVNTMPVFIENMAHTGHGGERLEGLPALKELSVSS